MNPLRIHDYLVLARGKVFDVVRSLTAEQYLQQFSIGLNSVGRTLTHTMICEWAYIQRMQGFDLPPYETWPIQDEKPPPFSVIEETWTKQAVDTRAAVEAVSDWDANIEYPTDRDGRRQIVTASKFDIVTQLAFHELHHRAQVMYMLRELGRPVEDLDFNAMMYTRRDAD